MSDKKVCITWWDHYRYDNSSWLSIDEIDDKFLCECETIGFIIKETPEAVCIAETRRIRTTNVVYSGVMVIGKKLIKKRRNLE